MRNNLISGAQQLLADRKRKRKLYATVSMLGLALVISVFYLLSAPAITAGGEPSCGLEEHLHTDLCFGDVVVCGLEETVVAEQAEEEQEQNVEPPVVELVCELVETAGHEHSDDCYVTTSEQICAPVEGEEHEHGEGCFVENTQLVCELAAEAAHLHADDCFAVVDEQPEINNELEGETEDDGAFETAHTHTAECYETGLVCELIEHEHEDSCFEAVMMRMGIMALNTDASSDLADFLDSFTITDSKGNEVSNGGTVYLDQDYTIRLSFSETPDGEAYLQFAYDNNGELVYDIPDSIVFAEGFSNFITMDGDDVGEFTVEVDANGNGTLRVKFGDNSEGKNLIDEYANLSFSVEMTAKIQSTGSGNEEEIDFGDDATITVMVVPTDNTPHLDVEKVYINGFDHATNTVQYKVKITAVGDSITINNIEEKLNGFDYKNNSYFSARIVDTISGTLYRSGSSLSIDVSYAANNVTGGQTVTTSYNGSPVVLAQGEYIELVYTVELNDGVSGNVDGMLGNTASVSGTTSGNIPVTGSDSVEVSFKKDFVGKAKGVIDEANGRIAWTAYVGDNYSDLRGVIISDEITGGSQFTGDITINVQRYTNEQWVTIETRRMPGSGTEFSYTVPSTDDLNLRYEFVYYTTYNEDINPYGVKNSLYIDEELGAQAGVIVGTGLSKDGAFKTDEDGNLYIEYTISAEIPSSAYDKRVQFFDQMVCNGHVVVPNILGVEFKVTDSYGSEYSGDGAKYVDIVKPNMIQNDYSGYEHELFVVFDGEEVINGASKWMLNIPATITITYRVGVDSVVPSLNGTIESLFLNNKGEWGAFIENHIKLFIDGQLSEVKQTLKNDVTKKAYHAYLKDGKWISTNEDSFDQTEYDDAKANGNVGFKYSVGISGIKYVEGASAPIFFDEFDEGLVYVENSMSIFSWSYAWYIVENVTVEQQSITLDFATVTKHKDWSGNVTTMTGDHLKKWYTTDYGNSMVFSYVLKIDPDNPLLGINSYDNTAHLKVFLSDTDENGFDLSASTSITYGDPVVEKNMEAKAGMKVAVTIDINPDGTELSNNSYLIRVEDVMTNLSLYSTSLEVEYFEDSEWKKATLLFNESETEYGYIIGLTDDGKQKVTFWLPDETHLKITYLALVDEDQGESVNVSNSVQINGFAGFTDEAELVYDVKSSSGEASGHKERLRIIKHDDLNEQLTLSGAEFAIYSRTYAHAAAGTEATVFDGTKFYYVATVTTGTDGTVVYENQNMVLGGVWAIVETKAPTGYIKNENPIIIVFGTAKSEVPSTAIVISDDVWIPNTAYFASLPNTGGDGAGLYWALGLGGVITGAIGLILKRRERRAKI